MDKENRIKQLKELATDIKTSRLIEEMIDLEKELDELKQFEFYKVNPKNKAQMKTTDAFYAYQKCLSAYKEIVKLLIKETGNSETSPLREYLQKLKQ